MSNLDENISRICSRCGESKPETLFRTRRNVPSGISGYCIECARAYARHWRETHLEQARSLANDWARRHPQKKKKCLYLNRCHDTINNDIRRRRCTKKPCVICGNFKVDGHHPDYAKPHQVIWLCARHHKAWHRVFIPDNKGGLLFSKEAA